MIYVSSKVHHANKWLRLKREGAPIISTWMREAKPGQTANFRNLWHRIELEVRNCTVLLFYANAGDFPLKGAFVEVGMAIAFRKPVIVVLEGIKLEGPTLRPIGSWLHHERVAVYPALAVGLKVAQGYCGEQVVG